MTQHIACECGAKLRITAQQVGRQARCPRCGKLMLVPREAEGLPPKKAKPAQENSGNLESLDAAASRESRPEEPRVVFSCVVGCGVLVGGFLFLSSLLFIVCAKLPNLWAPLSTERLTQIRQPDSKRLVSIAAGAIVSESGNVLPVAEDGCTFLVLPGGGFKVKFPSIPAISGMWIQRESHVVVTSESGSRREISDTNRQDRYWEDEIYNPVDEDVEVELAVELPIRADERHQLFHFRAEMEVLYPEITHSPRFTNRAKRMNREGRFLVVSHDDLELLADHDSQRRYEESQRIPWWILLLTLLLALGIFAGTGKVASYVKG